MNKRQSKIIHEEFHTATHVQKKIIGDSNFTYRHILSELNMYVKPGDSILDIGCGAGTLCFYFANKGNHVTGIDISEKAIKTCNLTAIELGLSELTDFQVMVFPDDSPKKKYDLIIFTEVIEHLLDDNLALKNIYSLLNKNGIVLITTPSKNAPMYRWGFANKFDKRVGHVRRYSQKELVKQCQKVGLEVIDSKMKEGLLRNFLFINSIAGQFIRVINKFSLSSVITFIDDISLSVFGESNLFVIARKK